jgi:hypothetical protein
MFYQLEITTRCNFSCFYCAGRPMPQQDMEWPTFKAIVDGMRQSGNMVSLQGEGEPSLHPRFFDMAEYVAARGHRPYSILNGSRIDAARIARTFPAIAVSVDTLDEATAERIGRHNLAKVLSNLDELRIAMGPGRIEIMTVDLGQPLDALRAWVKDRGFGNHVVQPLERKDDYAKRYVVMPPRPLRPPQPSTCRFLAQNVMRFYTWSGQELPCCFIKDTSGIASIPDLKRSLERGSTPPGCSGCRELRPLHAMPGASARRKIVEKT